MYDFINAADSILAECGGVSLMDVPDEGSSHEYRVTKLRELVKFRMGRRDQFNWNKVEGSVGLNLPVDYKEIVEVFPPGYFQGFVQVIRPGDIGASRDDFLGYYAHRLDDMRHWREDEPARFPMPIFPEPGGLLPWGRSIRSDLFFWVTSSEDPADWSVVIADQEFAWWIPYEGGVCDLLIEIVSGRFNARPFEADLDLSDPSFQAIESLAKSPATQSTSNYWVELSRGDGKPHSRMADLVHILSATHGEGSTVDWTAAEDHLGFGLPSDYKAFIETYGPGRFRDIAIASPHGSRGDLRAMIDRTLARVLANPRQQPGRHPPIHPEQDGMIAWGETPDGWSCCWAPSDTNPERWGTVLLAPGGINCQYLPDLSFSAFLARYAGPDHAGLFAGRKRDLPAYVEFTPPDAS